MFNKSDGDIMQIAVIGAGICGMRCALSLQAQGFDVRVFDKGRTVGGRMTSKRLLQGYGDMGAQYFTARSELFQAEVARWQQQGAIHLWPQHLAAWSASAPEHGASRLRASSDQQLRYSGTPTMHTVVKDLQHQFEQRCNETTGLKNGLVHGLVHGLEQSPSAEHLSHDNLTSPCNASAWPQRVNVSHTLTTLSYQPSVTAGASARWQLGFADGKQWQADAVVLAMPPVQAHALLMTALDEAQIPQIQPSASQRRTVQGPHSAAPNKAAPNKVAPNMVAPPWQDDNTSSMVQAQYLQLAQFAQQLQQAPALAPCWAVLLQFSSVLPLDLSRIVSNGINQLDGIFIQQRPARWIACLDTKRPGAQLADPNLMDINHAEGGHAQRVTAQQVHLQQVTVQQRLGSLWLVHFSADWSAQHIDASADELQAAAHAELAAVLADVLTSPMPAPVAVQTHRWRYAISAESGIKINTADFDPACISEIPSLSLSSKSSSKSSIEPWSEQRTTCQTAAPTTSPTTSPTTALQSATEAMFAMPDCAIWAGGDWCLGGRVENAYLMGEAIAQHIGKTFAKSSLA
jgi:predicted NAD/FAD-dependent oxidoreductase